MPLTLPEILADLPLAASMIPAIEGSINKLQASKKLPSDYCMFASEVLAVVGPLVDAIAAQAKD